MKWNELVPVVISIAVIILVALFQKYSKLFAAVTATMPITIPLSLWIVYASTQGERVEVIKYTQSLLMGVIPTLSFVVTVWLAAKAGIKLTPMLLIGYTSWAIVLILMIAVRRFLNL